MPKTYTVNEVAQILGYSTNSIYTFLKEKRIKGVRVGRGRFRIPEEELARILHLSKHKDTRALQAGGVALSPVPRDVTGTFSGDAAVIAPPDDVRTRGNALSVKSTIIPPNIFDWLVGLAAYAAGLALYLFNSLFGYSGFAQYSVYVNAGKVIFVMAGLGIIASTVFGGSGAWRKIFYTILAVMGSANAVMLYQNGDVYGAIVYGSMALVIAMHVMFRLGGIVSVGLYISVIAVLVPIVAFVFPNNSVLLTAAVFVHTSPWVVGVAFSAVSLVFLSLFWVGYTVVPLLFTVASLMAAVFIAGVAVFYADTGMWSRSFFLVVISFFTGILPVWRTIQVTWNRRQLSLLHLLFIGITIMLTVAIMVVYLLQQSVWAYNKAEFQNKVITAQHTLVDTIQSVQSSMMISVTNPSIITALEEHDNTTLLELGKVIHESNPNMRRLVFLDAKGDGLTMYPIGTFDQPNFAFRDYFIYSRDTKEPFISNVFVALTDHMNRYVLVVAVPVLTVDKEFVGMLVGSINLDRLGNKIQQLAVEQDGEYFIIIDGNNNTIYHPKPELIGTNVPEGDVARRAVRGETNVVQNKLHDGTLGMVAYAPVPGMDWGISLRVPAVRAFALTSDAVLTVILVVLLMLVVAIVFLLVFQKRWATYGDSGS